MKYNLNKINIYAHNKWGGLVVKELNSIFGPNQISQMTYIVVNIGILTEYSILI